MNGRMSEQQGQQMPNAGRDEGANTGTTTKPAATNGSLY